MNMADHNELISEMPTLEKLSTQERLKLARKRRGQQLKKWSQREKEYNSKRKKIMNEENVRKQSQKSLSKKNDYKVHFVPSVMLLEAAARNDVEEVRRLLMLGVSPDSTNEDGLTALHQCCIDDSEEMMKLLIDFGANVNAKDSEQWTPLHAAATCGHLHLVRYLISKGADLLAVNADGNMPYDICEDEVTLDYIESEMAKRGITQEMIDQTRATTENLMLSELKRKIEAKEDLETRDHQGATPLHIASANGYISVVEFLLDHHVSTDSYDNDLWQPIHAAACWGHPDVLELLVQNGADINAKTKNGETPFDICEDPELKERIIQLKNEMETKRASQQSNRLKRSHSQNTRSHSVRRTSIREKSQISRREAREEARLRHEKESQQDEDEVDGKQQLNAKDNIQANINHLSNPSTHSMQSHYQNNTDSGTNNIDSGTKNIDSATNNIDLATRNLDLATSNLDYPNFENKKSNDSDSELSVSNPTKVVNNLNSPHNSKNDAVVIRNTGYNDKDNQVSLLTKASDGQIQAISRTSSLGNESVKVEIHVTVNTTPTYNTGTLSDLKKQRAEKHRNSVTLSSPSSGETAVHSNSLPNNNSHKVSATYIYEPPPSPSTSIKKFRGDPSDIVGETKKKGCCKIM